MILLWLLALSRAVVAIGNAQLLFNQQEWYFGKCEQRWIEVEIAGQWIETKPGRCG